MCPLPPEIITRIFQALADDGLESPYEWWNQSDESHRNLDAAALVCKTWNALVKPFRTFFNLQANTEGLSPNEWNGGYARNGNVLSMSIAIKSLHVEWMEDDPEDDDFMLVLPLCFNDYLVAEESSLVALSLQGDLLQAAMARNHPRVGFALQRLLKQVERLHVYSDASGSTKYGDLEIPGYGLPWNALAEFVWKSGRIKPLKELALSVISIAGPFNFEEAPPCPASTLVLTDVWFEQQLECTEVFPKIECLVWKQSPEWNILDQFNSHANLKFKVPSKTLKHLRLFVRTATPRRVAAYTFSRARTCKQCIFVTHVKMCMNFTYAILI